MWLGISFDLIFYIEIPTPFILMSHPRSGIQQWIAKAS